MEPLATRRKFYGRMRCCVQLSLPRFWNIAAARVRPSGKRETLSHILPEELMTTNPCSLSNKPLFTFQQTGA